MSSPTPTHGWHYRDSKNDQQNEPEEGKQSKEILRVKLMQNWGPTAQLIFTQFLAEALLECITEYITELT